MAYRGIMKKATVNEVRERSNLHFLLLGLWSALVFLC